MAEEKRGRSGETLEDRQTRFLIAFRNSITDTAACKAAGISRESLYRWIREDVNGFAARHAEADRDRAHNLEATMYDVLSWASTEAGFEKLLRYPTLLMFALKGSFPERYGDRTTLGAETARQLIDELMKMKDDPKAVSVSGEKSVDDQLKDLGFNI